VGRIGKIGKIGKITEALKMRQGNWFDSQSSSFRQLYTLGLNQIRRIGKLFFSLRPVQQLIVLVSNIGSCGVAF